MKAIVKLLVISLSLFALTACQSSKWKVDVNLTPEEEKRLYTQINGVKEVIRKQTDETGRAEIQAYISLARAYRDLGDLKKSAKVYEDLIDDGFTSSALHNNLGRLYEDVGEYEKAIEQFRILVEKFVNPSYMRDITLLYIELKERKLAEKYFNAWQLEFNTTEVEIQNKIKALRAEEKEAK